MGLKNYTNRIVRFDFSVGQNPNHTTPCPPLEETRGRGEDYRKKRKKEQRRGEQKGEEKGKEGDLVRFPKERRERECELGWVRCHRGWVERGVGDWGEQRKKKRRKKQNPKVKFNNNNNT